MYVLALALALLAAAERQIFARRHKVDFGHDICLVTPIFPPTPSSSIRGTATVPVSLNTVGCGFIAGVITQSLASFSPTATTTCSS